MKLLLAAALVAAASPLMSCAGSTAQGRDDALPSAMTDVLDACPDEVGACMQDEACSAALEASLDPRTEPPDSPVPELLVDVIQCYHGGISDVSVQTYPPPQTQRKSSGPAASCSGVIVKSCFCCCQERQRQLNTMKSERAASIVEDIKCDFCGYFAEDMWSIAVQQRATNLLGPERDISHDTREFIDDDLCTV